MSKSTVTNFADLKPTSKTFEIVHPSTGENLGIRVTVMSAEDERMKPIARKMQDQQLEKRRRNKTISSTEIEHNTNRLIAAAILDWDWYGEIQWNGEKPECTRENVMDVLQNQPIFKTQVSEEIEDTEGFFDK